MNEDYTYDENLGIMLPDVEVTAEDLSYKKWVVALGTVFAVWFLVIQE